MTKFLIRWGINALALYAAVWLVPGIAFFGDWTGMIWLALILGLLNALVRPLLKFLTCPLIILTLGLFTIVINTVILLLTSQCEYLPPIWTEPLGRRWSWLRECRQRFPSLQPDATIAKEQQ